MILNTKKTKCETNMTGKTGFTIAANASMFRILSDGLYSNKIKAVIREVSCNAYDANVDAGNGDVPIVVHLPNDLEPFFSIKDSGPGLNPEQMVDIYTQYGNSTKTDNNNAIGCLGLGSKSPFSYIDSFTVISVTRKPKYVRKIKQN
jgi:sensor histidine kinase regulating citrate/malate metabolism